MPAYQQEHRDRAVSSQTQPHTTPAGETVAPSSDSLLIAEAKAATQFRFRILVVDDEPSICEIAGQILEGEGLRGSNGKRRAGRPKRTQQVTA